eukprot:1527720-Prymnesium_polylepis.1
MAADAEGAERWVKQEMMMLHLLRGQEVPKLSRDQPVQPEGSSAAADEVSMVPTKGSLQDSMRGLTDETSSFAGLAWEPLKLKLDSNKLQLLVGLAKSGIYSVPAVCELVAREMTFQNHPLLEHALTRFASGTPTIPVTASIFEEIIDIWASQLLGLASMALKLQTPPT